MSRLLAELLGAREPAFSLLVRRLEAEAGRPSADIRLSTEIIGKSKQKIEQLQLDAVDTNGPELYHSLLHLLQKHDDLLVSALGNPSDSGHAALLRQIKLTIQKLSIPKTCWAIKPAAAKRLLKGLPPKTVMKQLGYRSLDSMLKREKCTELFAAAVVMESVAWRERLLAKYKSLTPSDFEKRELELVLLDEKKWGAAVKSYVLTSHHNLLCIHEMGALAILPVPESRLKGVAITLLPHVIHSMHEVRLFSIYAMLCQVRPGFGKLIAQAAMGKTAPAATFAGNTLPWLVLHRHFGTHAQRDGLHIFEPHVQREDLAWHSPAAVVASLHGQFEFWQDSEYVGAAYSDGVVSYNLLDASLNYCNNVPYHKRIVYYMREALWHELLARYLRQPHVEQNVLKQMETNLTV